MLFLIFAAASFLSAEEIKKEETPAVQQVEDSETNDHKTEKETPVLQIEKHEEKEEFHQHEIYEFPITLGLFFLEPLGHDISIFTFVTLFYPPISAAVINYDSKFNFGSVYELAKNYTFIGNSFLEAGLHLKINMDLYYNSPSLGGGLGAGLFLLIDDTVMLKAGGRAAFYQKIPYAGPEATINFTDGDSVSFNCSYCYGFTSDHKKLWRASCILSFYVD